MSLGTIMGTLSGVSVLDAILIVLLLAAAGYGFLKGIIRMAGDFLGVLIGIWVAGYYFIPFYEWTQSLYFGYENVGRVISFLLLLAITRKLVSLVVLLIDKFIDFIGIVPFLGVINRLGGVIVGFVTASIFLGVAIYFVSRYSMGFAFDKMLVESYVAKLLLPFGEFASMFLPDILRQLHSLI